VSLLTSLGLVSALAATFAKLRLGIPGHSAVLWLVPIVLGRCLVPQRAAGTMASTSAALAMFCLRGFSLRWPLVATFGSFWLVGPALDLYVATIARFVLRSREHGRWPVGLRGAAFAALAGVAGNYAHLALKLLFGAMRPHAPRFGLASGLYEMVTYLVFGLAAGLVAYAVARPFLRAETHDA